jgi:hypothetical protein
LLHGTGSAEVTGGNANAKPAVGKALGKFAGGCRLTSPVETHYKNQLADGGNIHAVTEGNLKNPAKHFFSRLLETEVQALHYFGGKILGDLYGNICSDKGAKNV